MKRNGLMINTKEELKEWIRQDRVSCGYSAKRSFQELLIGFIAPNYILVFLRQLRKVEYLTNCTTVSFRAIRLLFNRLKLRRIQLKLGFSIPANVFGPGLSIAHYGTIVVSQYASVGSNCRLHVGVNIGASSGKSGAPKIGNNVYIGPGAIIFGEITIADGVSVGANSTVNKSFEQTNIVIAGTPAKIVKEGVPLWNSRYL